MCICNVSSLYENSVKTHNEIAHVGIIYFTSFWKDDEDTRTTAKEITLEEMHSAAVEVDGTGTVDQSSSAAERLQHNQTASSTVENSHEQVH